jgi:hypothetical protein
MQWSGTLFPSAIVGVVAGDELVYGHGADAQLHRYSPVAGNLPSWGLSQRKRVLGEEEWKAVIDENVTRLEASRYNREQRAALEGFYRTMVPPEFLPEFRSVLPGTDGSVWIEDFPRPADTSVRWYRIVQGRATDWFTIPTGPRDWNTRPSGPRVLAFDSAHVAVLETDELGVQTVVIYGLGEA